MKAELKQALENCSAQERMEASLYLRALELSQDADYHEEMLKRSEEIRSGESVFGSETVRELDESLSSHGL